MLTASSFLSYRGAVSAAMQYGLFMDIAYDLHRFDLIKALHLDLPANTEEEEEIGEQLRMEQHVAVQDDESIQQQRSREPE